MADRVDLGGLGGDMGAGGAAGAGDLGLEEGVHQRGFAKAALTWKGEGRGRGERRKQTVPVLGDIRKACAHYTTFRSL